jgi:lipopolysaccharide assembly outer membrane protein LptD (OstA)
MRSDSLAADTTLMVHADSSQKPGVQLEGPITYTAQIVRVSRSGNKIYLNGNAKVIYQTLTLEAEKITINQLDKTMYAEGIPDTSKKSDEPEYIGTPVFSDRGEEPIRGKTLFYNFETKRGKIGAGKTKMPPGYYKGEDIYKITDKTLLVQDGYFTTCEYIDEPHFYFRSPRMRVEMHEKLVARPVYLYIADVPVMVIPFGVFPNKKGRHSGILIPSYGESSYGGRFLKNMGYYWAPNDYLDATFTTDYYDKLGFTYQANMNYVLRYLLNGRVSGFYFPRDPNNPDKRNRWAFQFTHSQTIDPTLRLAASGKFQSDGELAKDYAADYNRRVDQILTSNITLSKKWTGSKNSMQLSMSRTENLQTGVTSYTAPNLRFSRSQSSLYETITGESVRGQRQWYQEINFSYSGRLLAKGSRLKTEDETFETQESKGVDHAISLNSPQKVFKYFNITPALSYNSIWVDETTAAELDTSTNRIITSQQKGFSIRRTYNGSVGINTTVFGLFEPNIGSLKFIRHKIDPRVTFQFAPDFMDPGYGYFTEIADTTGRLVQIDKYGKNPFGGTPRGKTQAMQISLNNFFQAKLIDGDKETKLDLFKLNFSTGYNFLADSLKWQALSSNFSASPLSGVNITLTSTHSFYKRGAGGRGYIDEFTFPRLINLNANMGFSIDQSIFSGSGDKEKKGKLSGEETDEQMEGQPDYNIIDEDIYLNPEDVSDEFAAKRVNIPWRINFTVNYNADRSDINRTTERFNIKAAANVSVTKNWKINWSGTYDAVKKDLVYQSISIYRDLHCWEMSFNWQPTVGYYSFRINVKADILQDLKLTKHPSGSARNVAY